MCITEGLITNVMCIDSTCSTTLKAPSVPKTKADHTLLPCTSLPRPTLTVDTRTNIWGIVLHPFAHLPSTMEQIFPENSEMVSRYIRLVKQKFYEKTGSAVYCPRPSCQHPTVPANEIVQVVVCSRCTYAFCRYCRATWHGAEVSCRPQNGYPPPFPHSGCPQRVLPLQPACDYNLGSGANDVVGWYKSTLKVTKRVNES